LIRCEQKTTEAGGDGPIPNITSEGSCSKAKQEVISNNIVTSNFNIVTDKSALLKFYVTLYLETRFDPSSPMDPMKNPQYILETKVFPSKHSW
jgi:subtilase family serine protease